MLLCMAITIIHEGEVSYKVCCSICMYINFSLSRTHGEKYFTYGLFNHQEYVNTLLNNQIFFVDHVTIYNRRLTAKTSLVCVISFQLGG